MKKRGVIIGIIILAIIIIILGIVFFPSKQSNLENSCPKQGEMCGGIQGIICCNNLECDYGTELGMPDASGKCKNCNEEECEGVESSLTDVVVSLNKYKEECEVRLKGCPYDHNCSDERFNLTNPYYLNGKEYYYCCACISY